MTDAPAQAMAATMARSAAAWRCGETVTTEVPALLAGVRADRGVSMVADVSRAAAAELIAAGRVLVDGGRSRLGAPRSARAPRSPCVLPAVRDAGVAPEPDVRFEVVHADELVAVVDKPAGLVVHPGAGHDDGTLVGGLLARFPDLADLVTTGSARPTGPGSCTGSTRAPRASWPWPGRRSAYRALVAQLATRTMERRYLALVAGDVAEDRGEVEAPIGRSSRTPTKMAVTAAGKPARTAYTVVERHRRRDGRRRCSSSRSRAGGPIRYASTWRPSATPWSGTPATGWPTSASASGRFFLHAFKLALRAPGHGRPHGVHVAAARGAQRLSG